MDLTFQSKDINLKKTYKTYSVTIQHSILRDIRNTNLLSAATDIANMTVKVAGSMKRFERE